MNVEPIRLKAWQRKGFYENVNENFLGRKAEVLQLQRVCSSNKMGESLRSSQRKFEINYASSNLCMRWRWNSSQNPRHLRMSSASSFWNFIEFTLCGNIIKIYANFQKSVSACLYADWKLQLASVILEQNSKNFQIESLQMCKIMKLKDALGGFF